MGSLVTEVHHNFMVQQLHVTYLPLVRVTNQQVYLNILIEDELHPRRIHFQLLKEKKRKTYNYQNDEP